MITQELKNVAEVMGIKSFRMNVNSPIIQVDDYQCITLHLDTESGGIWYRLDPEKMAIPMETGLVYVAPQGILAIQFNP